MRAILILGAAVWPDGPSPTLVRRTHHAAALWRRDPAALIVPCGGLGTHPPTEAEAMRALLRSLGVPAEAIVTEDRSTTTLENIRFALPILRDRDVREVVLVTDATHAPRARMTARAFGLVARADCPPLRGGSRRQVMRGLLREGLAIAAYWWRLRPYRRNRHIAADKEAPDQ